VRLRVRYHRPAELVRDHDEQLACGGLLVRVEPPAGLSLFDAIELEIVPPDGSPVLVSGQVVQLLPGVGVAVGLGSEALAALAGAMVAARAAGDRPGRAAEHALATRPGAASPPPAAPAGDAYTRVRAATTAEKIQMALHGGKDERALILRDINRSLHRYVLQNPHLGVDEVLAIAKMPTVSPELLVAVSERKDWAQRQDIATALVRNPKTPPPVAARLLDYVGTAELRRLVKDPGTRTPVRQAASKKLL